MNCRRFKEELKNQGNLTALETDAAFGEHLKNCAICQTKWAEYGELFELLKTDGPPMPEDAYWVSFPALVQERIEKGRDRPRWKPILGWSLPAAALVLIAGIALFTSREKPNPANFTTEEAFNFAEAADSAADIPLPKNTLTAVTAEAEDELVGSSKVEELVYALSDEQLNMLEKKLTSFKL